MVWGLFLRRRIPAVTILDDLTGAQRALVRLTELLHQEPDPPADADSVLTFLRDAWAAAAARARTLEDEAEALERMASIGELAGVLAHEFIDFLNMLLLHVAVLEYR